MHLIKINWYQIPIYTITSPSNTFDINIQKDFKKDHSFVRTVRSFCFCLGWWSPLWLIAAIGHSWGRSTSTSTAPQRVLLARGRRRPPRIWPRPSRYSVSSSTALTAWITSPWGNSSKVWIVVDGGHCCCWSLGSLFQKHRMVNGIYMS